MATSKTTTLAVLAVLFILIGLSVAGLGRDMRQRPPAPILAETEKQVAALKEKMVTGGGKASGVSLADEVQKVGAFSPHPLALPQLAAGEVGFVIAGIKNRPCRLGK